MSLKIVRSKFGCTPTHLSARDLEVGKVYRRASVPEHLIPKVSFSLVRCVRIMIDKKGTNAVEDLSDGVVVTADHRMMSDMRFIEVEATLTYKEK